MALGEIDRRLSHLTWFEIGLPEGPPTAIDAGRRRNRFATLGQEITAGRKMLSRVTRVRALRYLLSEVRGLRATLAAKGELTVTELTRADRAFGGDRSPLRDHLDGLARRLDQAWSALHDALTSEEALLIDTIKTVRRVPDPVPPLKPGQMRWLSFRQLARLSAAARYQFREDMLVMFLAVHFYETKPPRG
jgi:DNA-binding transcriptional ArsR family regulator